MKTVILIVLDGFGLAPPGPGNAIYLANPPNFNSYLYSFPNTTLKASGEAVGLPAGEVGNTEVGHINLGAGRVVFQDLPRINTNIADGSFFKNEALLGIIKHLENTGGKFHILGLIGEGVVHSSVEHLHSLLFFAKENGLKKVFIHAITDGRDSPPKSALETIQRLEEKLQETQVGEIASVSGRYYSMDRDRRWERIEKAYLCLTEGLGLKANSAKEAIMVAYNNSITDEFIEPTSILGPNSQPKALISTGDAVIFFNFRIDRPRELTKAFVLDNFTADANKSLSFDPYAIKYYKTHYPTETIVNPPFNRREKIKDLYFVTMTEYEKNLPVKIAFPPNIVKMPLGRAIAEHDKNQLRLSESEKERFVTFYFNGQREAPFTFEDRLIIPSPKVPTYDSKPEMSAFELTDTLVKKIYEQKYPFILINYANADMVGHTGNIEATVKAIRVLDQCLGKLVNVALSMNCTLLITADHGNAEQKINLQTGEISTEHTDNPVPLIVIDKKYQGRFTSLQSGILADIGPTVLKLLNIDKPVDMTGRDLLEELQQN